MSWSEKTMSALDKWLKRPTWYNPDADEDECFYEFLLTVWWEGNGSPWDPKEAMEIMMQTAKSLHPGFEDDALRETIEQRHAEGTATLDFINYVVRENKTGILTKEVRATGRGFHRKTRRRRE